MSNRTDQPVPGSNDGESNESRQNVPVEGLAGSVTAGTEPGRADPAGLYLGLNDDSAGLDGASDGHGEPVASSAAPDSHLPPEPGPAGGLPKANSESSRQPVLMPDGSAAVTNPPTEVLPLPDEGQPGELPLREEAPGVRSKLLSEDGVEREIFGAIAPEPTVIPEPATTPEPAQGTTVPVDQIPSADRATAVPPWESDNATDVVPGVQADDAATSEFSTIADTHEVPVASVPADPDQTLPIAAETAIFATPSDSIGFDTALGEEADMAKKAPKSKRGRRAFLIVGLSLVVLAGIYAGAALFFADKVPGDTTVAGIDISKQSSNQAVKTLETKLKARTSEPLELKLGEQTATVIPSESGLTFDAKATVAKVTGFSLVPSRLLAHISGGSPVTPVSKVDSTKLDAALGSVAESLATPPVDGAVAFVEGAIEASPAQLGVGLDQKAAAAALPEEWLVKKLPLELPSVDTDPAITQAMVDAAVSGPAAAVLSGPVTVQINEKPVELPPDAIAAHATFAPVDGVLELSLNGEELVNEILNRTNDIGAKAIDASIRIENGAPVITGGQVGMSIDPVVLATVVTTAAASTSERTAVATMAETQPAITKADIEALGVKEVVGSQSINLTANANRTHNLVTAAAAVNGTLVQPGETFSLCKAIGGATAAKGYRAAGVISDGMHIDEVGGGLSQMATTLYGAAFFSGMEDAQHKAHSQYIERYPAGREATLYCPTVDMKFKNVTDHGVLMQVWVAGGQTHASFWSTKIWDNIEAVPGGRTNQTSPGTETKRGPKCVPSSAGNGGFRIAVTRNFYRGGALHHSDSVTTTYSPVNRIQCEA